MEKYLKVLQSNKGCINNGFLYNVTEKNYLISCIEIATGKAGLLNKTALKNRVDFMCIADDTLYMIDISAKWLAETKIGEESITYHYMNIPQRITDNFSFIDIWDTKIVMILRRDPIVYFFDISTNSFSMEKLNVNLEGNIIDSACRIENEVIVFISGIGKMLRYNLRTCEVVEKKEMRLKNRVMDSFCEEGIVYALSADCVYDVSDDYSVVVSLEQGSKCSKMCKGNEKLWLMPGKGDDIYIYDINQKKIEKYNEYPEGYLFDRPENWDRFIGKAEDENYFYWCMRTNNRILCIDRKTGKEKWLKPYIENEKEFYSIVLNNSEKLISEELCDLSVFLSFITND